MASVITHALVGAALEQASNPKWRKDWRFWRLLVTCSILPDIDSIGFFARVPYGSLWGHRGITHSLLFAAVVAVSCALVLRRAYPPSWNLGFLLFLVIVSHGVLDAMTNGGLGVAFFSPFNPHRYFFLYRPIQVSPIGISRFFSDRGLSILISEMLWIWCPALLFAALVRMSHRWRRGDALPLPAEPNHFQEN
ncbi:MAG: metal-dependent hydrolase [Terriglobales bacterium]